MHRRTRKRPRGRIKPQTRWQSRDAVRRVTVPIRNFRQHQIDNRRAHGVGPGGNRSARSKGQHLLFLSNYSNSKGQHGRFAISIGRRVRNFDHGGLHRRTRKRPRGRIK